MCPNQFVVDENVLWSLCAVDVHSHCSCRWNCCRVSLNIFVLMLQCSPGKTGHPAEVADLLWFCFSSESQLRSIKSRFICSCSWTCLHLSMSTINITQNKTLTIICLPFLKEQTESMLLQMSCPKFTQTLPECFKRPTSKEIVFLTCPCSFFSHDGVHIQNNLRFKLHFLSISSLKLWWTGSR